jgi:glycerophosphoryl diester phosphodiesterase
MSWLTIAHRGASGTRPELTRVAFERALEIGVDMIELDVQLTSDRELVVLHDRELGRTVAGSGPVRDRTFAELRSVDAGRWFAPEYAGQSVMSLREVFELVDGRARLNVEIKSPEADWEATAEVLLRVLRQRHRLESTLVSSFDFGALRCLREREPRARLGVLWRTSDWEALWSRCERLSPVAINLLWGLAEPSVIREAQRRGLQVIVWTVNDPDAIERLVRMGVDGIITDFPERFTLLSTP